MFSIQLDTGIKLKYVLANHAIDTMYYFDDYCKENTYWKVIKYYEI